MISKSRYLAAQMLAYLKDDLWLTNARIANGHASRLAEGLRANSAAPASRITVQANEVFAVIPRKLNDDLLAAGANFYDWMPDGVPGGVSDDEIFVRFVLSYATPAQHVDQFLQLAQQAGARSETSRGPRKGPRYQPLRRPAWHQLPSARWRP